MKESVNFDRATQFYDATRGFPNGVDEKIGQFIIETARLNQQTKLLEVGVGTGRISLALSDHIPSIIGADISYGMLQVLQNKQDKVIVHPTQADGIALPYATNTFDTVLIVHVLHLVPHPEKILNELKRILKPDGYFIHCFVTNGDKNLIDPVVLAQMQSRPKSETGTNRKHVPTIIEDKGWQLEKNDSLPYVVTESAQQIYDNVRNRVWSSLWDVSDEALQISLDTIAQTITKYHDDNYDAQIRYQKIFTVQLFRASS